MADSATSGATPQVAEAIPAPAPKPEARSLEPSSEQNFVARAAAANSPAAIRAMLKEARTMKIEPAAPVEAKPAEGEPAAETAPETSPTEETPAVDETPAEAVTAEAPEAAPADADEDDAPPEDGPVSPSQAKKLRLRLPENDKVGRLAAAYMQRNRDLSMEDAMARAKTDLGIKPEAAKAEPAKPKSDLPETIEAVDTTLDQLDADREKALTELRFEDVAKIDRRVRQLDRQRVNLERADQQKQTEAAKAYDAQFTQSETKASDLYPDAAKADSEFGKRMAEIEADLKANGDPLFHSPEKPLRIAQMVAREKNIAPKSKSAPAAPAKAAAPAIPALKKGIVPAGSSRTTQPVANAQPAIHADIQAAKNPHQLRQVLKGIGIKI